MKLLIRILHRDFRAILYRISYIPLKRQYPTHFYFSSQLIFISLRRIISLLFSREKCNSKIRCLPLLLPLPSPHSTNNPPLSPSPPQPHIPNSINHTHHRPIPHYKKTGIQALLSTTDIPRIPAFYISDTIFTYLFPLRYSSIPLAPARPASMARITVAAPVTASPPAYTPSLVVLPLLSSAMIHFHLLVSRPSVVEEISGFGEVPRDMMTASTSMV